MKLCITFSLAVACLHLFGATYLKFSTQTWVPILSQWLGGGLATKRMLFLILVVLH
jgi:hypothetical protein